MKSLYFCLENYTDIIVGIMEMKTIVSEINGTVRVGLDLLQNNVDFAFASDLMSDVLTVEKEDILLITGLANLQTIRTAEMADIRYIIFARGKNIDGQIVQLASENNMVIITTPYSVFRVSGILYQLGIQPVF